MNLKKIIRAANRYVFDSNYRFRFNAAKGKYDTMEDEEYLKKFFLAKMGYELNLNNPETFNEKMQWLKLNYRCPIFTQMVDKYEVRKYIANIIGEEYSVPLIAVWDSPDDIEFDKLPSQFVLKTTHGCGGMYICRDKSTFDLNGAKKALKKTFYKNYYMYMREWPYKNVQPRVIAEQYMQNGDEVHLKVYKIFNFNGIPKIIQAIQNDKTHDESIDYFDADWNLLDLHQNYPNSKIKTEKPKTLEKMLELSKKCSSGFPFLRTDWYEINGRVYFSEFTFYLDAGMEPFYPEKWDKILGSWITLPDTAIK